MKDAQKARLMAAILKDKNKHGGARAHAGRPKQYRTGRTVSFYMSGPAADCFQLLMLRWDCSLSATISRAITAAAALERGSIKRETKRRK